MLVLAGAGALMISIEVAIAITVLLAVVSLSYRQVCRAYPSGGGAYVVARENLGPLFGLIAAAALLIDYVMTVAVSTASAVAQVYSVVPAVYDLRIEIALAAITLITVANLRGLREAGLLFASPTYVFVGLAFLMIGMGVVRVATGQGPATEPPDEVVEYGTQTLGIFLILRSFAAGSVALTGVEAIANGVPAFKPPEAKNAANTMLGMAILLGVLFIGITVLANAFDIRPTEEGGATVVAIVAAAVFGDGTPLFIAFQAATALILFLAVNTSFNAFPRLAAILAQDGYMPRQFSFRGDRLAFSWGIVVLATIAGALLVIFGGDTHALIPLYSVGVFVCFTLSQIGMVRHWFAVREPGWWARATVNAAGGVLTFVVLLVVASMKFVDGAWLVLVLIPAQVLLFWFISRQYTASRAQVALHPDQVVPAAAPPGAGHRPDRRARPGGRPGRQRRAVPLRRRAGRPGDRGSRRGGGGPRRVGAAGAGTPAGRRREPVPRSHRAAARLPRGARPRLAAGQGGADHDRHPPGVRAAPLVGAAPLQPVDQRSCGGRSSAGRTRS